MKPITNIHSRRSHHSEPCPGLDSGLIQNPTPLFPSVKSVVNVFTLGIILLLAICSPAFSQPKERQTSGSFATNSRIMHLGLLAYNILRLIDQFSLQQDSFVRNFKRVSRRRLKSVIQDLIYLACRLVFKANRWRIRLGKECPYFEVFQGLYYCWAT